jgi:hypothetical protein
MRWTRRPTLACDVFLRIVEDLGRFSHPVSFRLKPTETTEFRFGMAPAWHPESPAPVPWYFTRRVFFPDSQDY